MTDQFQILIEIGEVQRLRKPKLNGPPTVYSGQTVEAGLYIPAGDGLIEYRVQVEDTAEGWHKHRTEQAKALGQEPPKHPFEPTLETVELYRLPYRIDDGDVKWAEAIARHWDRDEFPLAVRDALIEAQQERFCPPYQTVVKRNRDLGT